MRMLVPAAALLLLATACSSGDTDDKAGPVNLPKGDSYASPGSSLELGKSALVKFSPNPSKAAALRITVATVDAGIIEDLRGYALPASAQNATPYYVKVSVANLAGSDLGRSAIPLWAETADGALIGASSFTKPFEKCASTPLPAAFAKGANLGTCLMYLMPSGTTPTAIAFRAPGSTRGVSWTLPSASASPSASPSATVTPAPTISPSPGTSP